MIKNKKRLLASFYYNNLFNSKKLSVIFVFRKLSFFSVNFLASLTDSIISCSNADFHLLSDISETNISRITKTHNDSRVLFALLLTVDVNVSELKNWIQWFTSKTSLEIQNLKIKYEFIYRDHSTLLLIFMFVIIWTRFSILSNFRFVDVVTFNNFISQMMTNKRKSKTVIN